MRPAILILHASGANRDAEAARACTLAGAAPEIVHINQLRRGERRFSDYQALLLPGGFTYGDALGAGARLSLDLHVYFMDQLQEFVASGRLVLGICNGFQTLVKAGILPGVTPEADAARVRRVTLTENASGQFECRWVHLQANPRARASWLAGIDDLVFCPVAHGEGNLRAKDQAALAELDENNLIAFRYVDAVGNSANGVYPINPNGSTADIAGLCNWAGNVVGFMPHPEDHLAPIQNPLRGTGRLGLTLFQTMVNAIQ